VVAFVVTLVTQLTKIKLHFVQYEASQHCIQHKRYQFVAPFGMENIRIMGYCRLLAFRGRKFRNAKNNPFVYENHTIKFS
jgi:hypothetical protein